MKIKFGLSVFFICFFLLCKSQWKPVQLSGSNVLTLKSVNGSLFAFAINNSSSVGGLYRSYNHGTTWQLVDSTDFKFVYVNDIIYDSLHQVYALVCSAQKGVFLSTDGNTWTNSGTLWSGDGITYMNGKLIITLPASGVGISTNGGTVWNVSNSGLPAPYYVHFITRLDDTLYLSNQGPPVYMSTNNGASWAAHCDSLIYFANCFYKHKGVVYSGLYLNGVAKFRAGYWTYYNSNLPATQHLSALNSEGDSLFCGGDSIGVWLNSTGTWQNFSCGLPQYTSVNRLVNDSGFLFAGTNNGIWKINLKNGCISPGITAKQTTDIVEIYPSITHDQVFIRSAKLPNTIEIFDINGKSIQTLNDQAVIDVKKYRSGIYFARIFFNSGDFVVKKFIVE